MAASSTPPTVLHRLVDDQLYDRGVLSVKFRVLHGRVVFFRPFVRRRTATTNAASRFVDRVIFVVATTGELVIADADACPKRSVPLGHVTTVLLDTAASTVALMFESSAAEHDVQLVFGPYPTGLGDSIAAVSTPLRSASHSVTPGSRVKFSNGVATGGDNINNAEPIAPAVEPLMSLKQFINVVLTFAPDAQVIQGSVASMELKLAKPKHFIDPAAMLASTVMTPLSPVTGDNVKGDTRGRIKAPPLSASPIHADTQEDVSLQDTSVMGGQATTTQTGGKRFRDLFPQTSTTPTGEVKRLGDDSDASMVADFATTVAPHRISPPPSTPSPARLQHQQQREVHAVSPDEAPPRASLRDIAARGSYHPPTTTSKSPLLPDTAADDSLQKFRALEPPYDHEGDAGHFLESDGDGGDGAEYDDEYDDEGASSAADTSSALRRFSLLHRKANEWNDGVGSATRNSPRVAEHHTPRNNSSTYDADVRHQTDTTNDPPLLSDMVRKLRNRRGEIQMQNLMMNGELKGIQQRIDALLNSYQRINPLPELEDHPVHRGQSSVAAASFKKQYDDDYVGSDYHDGEGPGELDFPKLMSATKEYNRALNLSLVLLNICRRQRQIHLHAEYDARERWRATQRRQDIRTYGGDGTATMSAHHNLSSSLPYHGNVFMGPDAALMLRSSYSEGGRTHDMQALLSMGF